MSVVIKVITEFLQERTGPVPAQYTGESELIPLPHIPESAFIFEKISVLNINKPLDTWYESSKPEDCRRHRFNGLISTFITCMQILDEGSVRVAYTLLPWTSWAGWVAPGCAVSGTTSAPVAGNSLSVYLNSPPHSVQIRKTKRDTRSETHCQKNYVKIFTI